MCKYKLPYLNCSVASFRQINYYVFFTKIVVLDIVQKITFECRLQNSIRILLLYQVYRFCKDRVGYKKINTFSINCLTLFGFCSVLFAATLSFASS